MRATLLVVGLVLSISCEAHILTEKECGYLARDTIRIAQNRDDGMTLEQAQRTMQAQLARVIGNPDAYIKDDEDVSEMYKLLPQIWASKATPEQLGHSIYRQCTAIAAAVV